MKINIEYDLDNEADRKSYLEVSKLREIVLNLEKLKFMLDAGKVDEMKTYFEEMIWKKLWN